MILIENTLCYSPLPPKAYARWEKGCPQGPAALFIDRVYGCPLLKKCGVDLEDISQGLHIWNLAWLLCPAFDDLPKQAKRKKALHCARLGPDESCNIILFADDFEDILRGPPTAFLRRVQGMKWDLPNGSSLKEAMRRAQEAESLGNPHGEQLALQSGNVILFDRWRRRREAS